LTDKFIQYQKIPSLQYYLCVEQEQQVVFVYLKYDYGQWMADTFTRDQQAIVLAKLEISFLVKDNYHS
jgi:Uma2 family endonuclease